MDLTPLVPAGRQIIESYGEGRFRVAGKVFAGSVLVFPDRTLPWVVAEAGAITLESLSAVAETGLAGGVQVLLLGCGARAAAVPAGLRQALKHAGVVVETMDTGAAARTYNVLAAEGRLVAAALIAIE